MREVLEIMSKSLKRCFQVDGSHDSGAIVRPKHLRHAIFWGTWRKASEEAVGHGRIIPIHRSQTSERSVEHTVGPPHSGRHVAVATEPGDGVPDSRGGRCLGVSYPVPVPAWKP